MKVLYTLCLTILLGTIAGTAWAGNEQQPAGARRISLGNAYTGVRSDFWTLYANPAGMAGMESMRAGVFLERRFLLNQMNFGTAGFAMPFQKRHVAGIEFGGFGFGDYNESHVGIGYSGSVLENFSLGVKLNYARTSIKDYGAAGAFIVDAGLNAVIIKGLSVGFAVFNANQANLNKEIEEQIPTTLAFGLAYQVSDKVLLVTDLEKQVNYDYSFRGGAEYAIMPYLKARIGASTAPVTLNAGLGFTIKGFDIDWANSFHEYLGYTPSLSLTYRFDKKQEAE